ncbi:YozE family protein [Staphylococcus sp. HKU1]|uniref:YozE family protein n=1 Tax=unclassified Staphylococcus TaxID=91994 RepID=UPI002040C713|nr:YozE family protein [Staphylococcus sp. Marseille-Q6910]
MTFYDFVIGFIDDDTPLGKLANCIMVNQSFPKHETCLDTLRDYFYDNYLDGEVLASANRALSLYGSSVAYN